MFASLRELKLLWCGVGKNKKLLSWDAFREFVLVSLPLSLSPARNITFSGDFAT